MNCYRDQQQRAKNDEKKNQQENKKEDVHSQGILAEQMAVKNKINSQ